LTSLCYVSTGFYFFFFFSHFIPPASRGAGSTQWLLLCRDERTARTARHATIPGWSTYAAAANTC